MKQKLIDPVLLKSHVFYAENREDLILQAFFPGQEKGFYVDVGAYDPDSYSVTKIFYLKGWRGINIEPLPERIKLFTEKRPGDINVNTGISNQKGELVIRSYDNNGLSTFSSKMIADYERKPIKATQKFKDIKVKVTTLKDLFAERKVTHIDFMKIDVEGFEYEVMEGNDWQKYRPEVVCIESNHIVKDWHGLIQKAGYELVFDDGLNEYYADSRTDRKAKFDYVTHVIEERGTGMRFRDFEQLELLHEDITKRWVQENELKKLLAAADKELKHYSKQTQELQEMVEHQQQELNSIKKLSKRLAYLIKKSGPWLKKRAQT